MSGILKTRVKCLGHEHDQAKDTLTGFLNVQVYCFGSSFIEKKGFYLMLCR